jgi:hypothetical protein
VKQIVPGACGGTWGSAGSAVVQSRAAAVSLPANFDVMSTVFSRRPGCRAFRARAGALSSAPLGMNGALPAQRRSGR